jgi:hypothetical protein
MRSCRCEQLALLHSWFAFFVYGNTGDEMRVYLKVMQVAASMTSQSNTSIMLQQCGNSIFSYVDCAALHASVCLCCFCYLQTNFFLLVRQPLYGLARGQGICLSTLHCTYRRLLQIPLSCLLSL